MRGRSLVVFAFVLAAVPSFALPPNLIKGGTFDTPDALRNWEGVPRDWTGIDALGRPTSGSVTFSAKGL